MQVLGGEADRAQLTRAVTQDKLVKCLLGIWTWKVAEFHTKKGAESYTHIETAFSVSDNKKKWEKLFLIMYRISVC